MTTYQWNAADYERNSAQQKLWAEELLDRLGLQGSERVLDIGCGDGKISAQIAARLPGGAVVAIDNSADMIALAEQRFPLATYPNLRFQLADASALPFQLEFDRVFSNAALHWVRDHRPVLQGIAAALQPGGKALLQMGGQGNAAEIVAGFDRLAQQEQWSGYFTGFSFPYGFHGPYEYRQWLAQAGLNALRVDLFPRDMVHPGREGLTGWLRTTWMPYTARVPQAERETFLSEMVDLYLEKFPPDSQGQTHVGMVRLEVEAEKI